MQGLSPLCDMMSPCLIIMVCYDYALHAIILVLWFHLVKLQVPTVFL